jgi:hypothetical protein
VQICICDVNVAIDLPGLPQIPASATDQSCAATSSANTLIGLACPHPAPWCANLHSARCSPRHRLPFPAGSFLGGFRTPATGVCRADLAGRHPKPSTKCEILAKSRCFLLCLHQQTSRSRTGRSVRCQEQTHAQQRNRVAIRSLRRRGQTASAAKSG